MLKIRRPLGRLIFNMGIAIPGKTVFLIERAPSLLLALILKFYCWYLTTTTNIKSPSTDIWKTKIWNIKFNFTFKNSKLLSKNVCTKPIIKIFSIWKNLEDHILEHKLLYNECSEGKSIPLSYHTCLLVKINFSIKESDALDIQKLFPEI